jgi:hypothetical protein
MDVINPEQVSLPCLGSKRVFHTPQARIAEEAGACAVMALERVPADIRAEGLVAVYFSRTLILSLSSRWCCTNGLRIHSQF